MNAADVGDWVVGGFGQDADYGYVFGRDAEGQMVVSWFGSMTQTILAAGAEVDLFATKEAAHEEFVFRMQEVDQ